MRVNAATSARCLFGLGKGEHNTALSGQQKGRTHAPGRFSWLMCFWSFDLGAALVAELRPWWQVLLADRALSRHLRRATVATELRGGLQRCTALDALLR